MRYVKLAGSSVPAIGQGTWYMGEDPARKAAEVAALQQGIELGLSLIDTAEMYAEGGAEEVVGQAIAGRRDQVFLVSKVYPHNASLRAMAAACERSLTRLGTDCIDLYLLHWRGQHPLEETVEAFERLREQGKIKRWGVSNFDVDDLRELHNPIAPPTGAVQPGPAWHRVRPVAVVRKRALPTMAYCPLAQAGRLLQHPVLAEIAERHGATVAQVSLAWVTRNDGVIAIPKAVTPEHVRLNAAAGALTLTGEDLRAIDRALPAPTRKQRLAMV